MYIYLYTNYIMNEKNISITDKDLIDNSFYITYVFLMTTATITFIEAMRTKDSKIRNILNLETCISVVAAFFYSKFIDKIESEDEPNYREINDMRYTDWSITTPIMLLVLVLVLLYNTNSGALPISKFFIILLLNYGMLGSGYIGELGILNKPLANAIGFAFFAGLFGYIYKQFLFGKYNFDNILLYLAFIVLWSFYGIAYYFDEVSQNVSYNVLDLFAKCFVGIFFWAYFTNIFVLK